MCFDLWRGTKEKQSKACAHLALETASRQNSRQTDNRPVELVARVDYVTNEGNTNMATLYKIDSVDNLLSVSLIQIFNYSSQSWETSGRRYVHASPCAHLFSLYGKNLEENTKRCILSSAA